MSKKVELKYIAGCDIIGDGPELTQLFNEGWRIHFMANFKNPMTGAVLHTFLIRETEDK